MAKSVDKDLPLKLRLRRILFSQGYWCPIEVEMSHYEQLGTTVRRRSLTDLDVLGVRYDRLFVPHRVVGDCKSGKDVSDVNRLFWLRGVMTYFGADTGYLLRPQVASHARAIAPKMGLRVLAEGELAALEDTVGVDRVPIPISDIQIQCDVKDLWGIEVAKGTKPTAEQLALKEVYSFLSYSYWYLEPHRRILTLVDHFQKTAELFNPGDARHVLLAFAGVERFVLSLLNVASSVQAQGGADVPRNARVYLYGGHLALKDKERFFDLLRRATGAKESLDPPWLVDVIELLGRLVRNPDGACDVLRHLTAIHLWCVHLGNTLLPPLNNSTENTAAIVLAKDVVSSFAKSTGLPGSLFASAAEL